MSSMKKVFASLVLLASLAGAAVAADCCMSECCQHGQHDCCKKK